MWMIIIVILIGVLLFAAKDTVNTNAQNQEKNTSLIRETIAKLKILEQYSHLPYMGEECGLVMIIPTDQEGDLYNPRSDRLKISLLLYTNNMETISSFEPRTEISSCFRLTRENNSLSYICFSSCPLFGDYKKFMPQLNEAVKEAFPNVKFEFDGSRVMTSHL